MKDYMGKPKRGGQLAHHISVLVQTWVSWHFGEGYRKITGYTTVEMSAPSSQFVHTH